MSIDISHSGIGGGLIVACLLYAGASTIAGQAMATRMIDQSGWHVSCPDGLKAAARSEPRSRTRIPERRCSDVTIWLPREIQELCGVFGNPDLNAQARKAERELVAQRRAVEKRRLDHAAASAGSKCSCADNVYKSDEFIALAIYAGSFRQISLPAVDDMQLGPKQGLATQQCQALGGES